MRSEILRMRNSPLHDYTRQQDNQQSNLIPKLIWLKYGLNSLTFGDKKNFNETISLSSIKENLNWRLFDNILIETMIQTVTTNEFLETVDN